MYIIGRRRESIGGVLFALYLVEPVMLEALLRDVLSRDDANHSVVAVQHYQMSQPHRAEKPGIASLYGHSIDVIAHIPTCSIVGRRMRH